MSVVRTVGSEGETVGADTALPPRSWETRTAHFLAHWGPSSAVVTAYGELDASNAGELAEYAQRCAAHCTRLILDLSHLDFMGTDGFAALHRISTWCASADLQWAVVPSRVVSRLLAICDPDNALPVADSVAATLARHDEPRRLLQLVTKPR